VADDLHPAAPSWRCGAALDSALLLPLSRAQEWVGDLPDDGDHER